MKKTPLLFWGNILFSLLLIFIETVAYRHFFDTRFHLPIEALLTMSLIVHSVLVIKFAKLFSKINLIIIAAILLVLNVATIGLYFVENQHFANYIFSQLHIHPASLKIGAFYSVVLYCITVFSNRERLLSKYVLIIPIFFYFFLFIQRLSVEQAFINIGSEDSLIEWLQGLICLCASIIFLKNAQIFSKYDRVVMILYICAALGLFVIAGEEISWGQRIFSLSTPEYIQERNVQGEITLHNLETFHNSTALAYIVIGVWGSILPFFRKKLPVYARYILPTTMTVTFFVPLLIYGLMRFMSDFALYKTWEESAEIMYMIGVLFFSLIVYLSKKEYIEK